MRNLLDVVPEDEPLVLPVPDGFTLEDFERYAPLFGSLHVELVNNQMLLMPPTSGDVSDVQGNLFAFLKMWALNSGAGHVYNCDAGFALANGNVRGPDAAFVSQRQYDSVAAKQRQRLALPFVPEFVAEVRSRAQTLGEQQAKMEEYLANGVQLGWLIDPLENRAYVYRAGAQVQEFPELTGMLSGDPVLPGFVFDLSLMRLA